jgi:hypothetical protein
MEAVIRELQDTMTVVANVQARQAAALKDMAEWLAGQDKRQLEHQRWLESHERAMAEFDEKLNALIPIVDSLIRGKQQ